MNQGISLYRVALLSMLSLGAVGEVAAADSSYVRVSAVNRYTIRVENVSAFDVRIKIKGEPPEVLRSGGSRLLDRSQGRTIKLNYTKAAYEAMSTRLLGEQRAAGEKIAEIEREREAWEATIEERTRDVERRLKAANETTEDIAEGIADVVDSPTIYRDGWGNTYIEQADPLTSLLIQGGLALGAGAVKEANRQAARAELKRPDFEGRIEKQEASIASSKARQISNQQLFEAGQGQQNEQSGKLNTISLTNDDWGTSGFAPGFLLSAGWKLSQSAVDDQWSERGGEAWRVETAIGVLPELRLGGTDAKGYLRLYLGAGYEQSAVAFSDAGAQVAADDEVIATGETSAFNFSALSPGITLKYLRHPAGFLDVTGGVLVYLDNDFTYGEGGKVSEVAEFAPLSAALQDNLFGSARLGLNLGEWRDNQRFQGLYVAVGAMAFRSPELTPVAGYSLLDNQGSPLTLPTAGVLNLQSDLMLGLSF